MTGILASFNPPVVTRLKSPSYIVSAVFTSRGQWDKTPPPNDPALALGMAAFTLPRAQLRPDTNSLTILPFVQESEEIPEGWNLLPRAFGGNIGRPDQRYAPYTASMMFFELMRLQRPASGPCDQPIILLVENLEREIAYFRWMFGELEVLITQRPSNYNLDEIQEVLNRLQMAEIMPCLAAMTNHNHRQVEAVFREQQGKREYTAQELAYFNGLGVMRTLNEFGALPPFEL